MTASASAVRHGLDQPTQWGADPAPSYRRLRDPDERRDESNLPPARATVPTASLARAGGKEDV